MKTLLINFILFFLICTNSLASSKRVYNANKDEVWRALLISLSSYPLDKNNYESGDIQTAKISEGQYWKQHNQETSPRNKYSMYFQVFNESNQRTSVTAKKTLVRAGDFFDEERELKNKGVEEAVILYRIHRELLVDRYVKKAFEK